MAHTFKLVLFYAQGHRCSVCGNHLRKPPSPRTTFDHVWPRDQLSIQSDVTGNILLSHDACNQKKGNAQPTGCEVIMLFMVNRRLGLPEYMTEHYDRY